MLSVIHRIDDKEIHEGDIMGIGDKGILAVGKDRIDVTKETIAADGGRRLRGDQHLLWR